MCEKCIELNEKIAHYRRIAAFPFDALTTARIAVEISNLELARDSAHLTVPGSYADQPHGGEGPTLGYPTSDTYSDKEAL
jgi:hypothetical protein